MLLKLGMELSYSLKAKNWQPGHVCITCIYGKDLGQDKFGAVAPNPS